MKKVLVVLITVYCQIIFAQKTVVTTFLNFTGKIDKYPIEMTIGFEKGKDSVYGEYYYLKSGKNKNIYIKGVFKENEINLVETTYITTKSGTNPKKQVASLCI